MAKQTGTNVRLIRCFIGLPLTTDITAAYSTAAESAPWRKPASYKIEPLV